MGGGIVGLKNQKGNQAGSPRFFCAIKRAFKIASAPLCDATWTTRHTYFIKLHFSRSAYGKQVSAVRAQVAVKMQEPPSRGGEIYYEDCRVIDLEPRYDHLFAKVELTALSSHVCPRAKGVVVRYEVEFDNGDILETDEMELQAERIHQVVSPSEFEQMVGIVGARFSTIDDAYESVCHETIEFSKDLHG